MFLRKRHFYAPVCNKAYASRRQVFAAKVIPRVVAHGRKAATTIFKGFRVIEQAHDQGQWSKG